MLIFRNPERYHPSLRMPAPSVSIIVVNRNSASSLQSCLNALREQPCTEIILVDDASSDNSVDVAALFPSLNLIALKEARGFAESVRRGYRACQGDLVAIIRSEVLLSPTWLTSLCSFLSQYPQAAACGGKNYLSQSAAFDLNAPYQGHVAVDPKDASPRALCGTRDEIREVACLSDAAFVVRRQAIQDLGDDFLDPAFLTGFALFDFLARASRKAWRSFYVPDAEAWLPPHTPADRALRGWIDSLARDRVLFCYRHFSDAALEAARRDWARKAALAVVTVPLRPWLKDPREKRANMIAFRWAASNRQSLLTQRQHSFQTDFDYHENLTRIQSPAICFENEYSEIVDLIPEHCKTVVDVGCGGGALGRLLKRTRKNVQVLGVELSTSQTLRARRVLDSVNNAGADDPLPLDWPKPDCVVFANVLEDLENPWATLRLWRDRIDDNGCIVIRLPNAAQSSVLGGLLAGKFEYSDSGVLDRKQRRFFTMRSAVQMIESSGLSVCRIERVVPIIPAAPLGIALGLWARLNRRPPLSRLASKRKLGEFSADLATEHFLFVAELA